MLGENVLYWIWLAEACGAASKNFVRLVELFSDPFEIYSLDEEQIEHIEGIGARLKAKLSNKTLEGAYATLKFCKSKKVDIITYGDKRYPSRLKQLEDPPVVLFCKGCFPDFNSRVAIGVVGTRTMSEYGKQSAYKIAYELACANVIVVSGMALGNDAVAACAAIGAGGDTVAVLGSGIDVIYPKEHTVLYEKIVKCGAVITEFMPSTPPEKCNFPLRNRIISGLCNGTLVVEGDHRSGALITAKLALKQGRDVFALPGNIDVSNSEGPNELIRDGSYAALCAGDIISQYEFLYSDVLDLNSFFKSKYHSDLDEHLIDKLKISSKIEFSKRSKSTSKRVDAQNETQNGSNKQNEKTNASAEKKVTAEQSDAKADMLAGLDDAARKVFAEMPIDTAVSPDALVLDGIDVSDVITALTMLELCGLISSLPGGLYIRK